MLEYPNINPVALHITDSLQIRWYGLMYLAGLIVGWFLLRLRTKNLPGWESTQKLNDLIFYIAIGAILGGRIGYMLFYVLPDWIASPTEIFKIWQGGMSFHGGLIGVLVGTWYFSRTYHETFLSVGDIFVPALPLALGLGRLGNFINGELWGTVTTLPWGMVFPYAGPLPRHPSQLYAIFFEGFLLFAVLWIYSSKPRKIGAVSGLFLLGYGLIRIIEEFFRQPDPQYGYLAFGWLTMGQILCLPMVFFGCYLLFCKSSEKFACKPI